MFILNLEQEPPIIQAIYVGDVEKVKSLIDKQEDINYQDAEKRSPLHLAAYCGIEEICKILLEAGARVNCKDSNWLTPLHRACSLKRQDVVLLLLHHQAEATARDKSWQTALHVAAANNAVQCAELVIPYIGNINISDRAGRTALHHAANNGHKEMVQFLLEKGANINSFDKQDRRAIHWSAYKGHTNVTQILMNFGAEISCKDKKQFTPLHCAALLTNNATGLKLLLEMGADIEAITLDGSTAMHLACLNRCVSNIEELINHKANLNAQNNKGLTALHYCSMILHGEVGLDLLLNERADIEMQAKDGKTALHFAALHGQYSQCDLLLREGAKLKIDFDGNTPLHIATRLGHESIIRLFIKYDSDLARKGMNDLSLLHMCSISNSIDCFKILLHELDGFDINSVDNLQRTCLHLAACTQNSKIIEQLIKAGADVNLSDSFGRVALHYACIVCDLSCIKALLNKDTVLDVVDTNGCTPFHYAAAYNENPDVMVYLFEAGCNKGARDAKGNTFLHYAALNPNKATLEMLLVDNASEILSESCIQQTCSPLHIAAFNSNLDVIKVLSNFIVNLDLLDTNGRSALHIAAYIGNEDCCEELIRQGASVFLKESVNRFTPVHMATIGGHVGCLKVLMKYDVSILANYQDSYNRTPLMLASIFGHADVISFLVENSACVNQVDSNNRTALHHAVTNGHDDCVKILIACKAKINAKNNRGLTPLHMACICGHAEVTTTLLENQAKIDACDIDGNSPLHWCCHNGNECCVEILLEHMNKSAFPGNKYSPLHCAVANNHNITTEMLLDHFNEEAIYSKDNEGRTALHIAAYSDHCDLLHILLKSGFNVDELDVLNRTPLMCACIAGNLAAIDLLIYMQANLNLIDADGNSILHHAVINKQENLALWLLDKIQDKQIVNSANFSKRTLLHDCCRNGMSTLLGRLLANNPDISSQDRDGRSALLDCAKDNNVAACMVLLLKHILSKDNPSGLLASCLPHLTESNTVNQTSTETPQSSVQSSDSEFY